MGKDKLNFYYPEINGIDLTGKIFLGVYKPNIIKKNIKLKELLLKSLQNPIGTYPLEKTVKKGDKILILSDDNTRSTPVNEILTVLLPLLHNLGASKEDIIILMALGTHRPMTDDELEKKLGKKIIEEYKVINHLWDDKDSNIYYGKTSEDIEIWGNKLLKECDFVIGLGHIVPHRVAGFSGGGKIVQPGVGAGETTGHTHWLSALVPGVEILGKRDNLVRQQIDESAMLMGLNFIINVVQDLEGEVVGVFAGDFIEAHKAGCKVAREVFGVKIPKADIVITDSYPADIELWQAAKGIYSSDLVVKKNGYVILVTPCYEGVSKSHPEIEALGYQTLEITQKFIEDKKLIDLSVAAHLVHVGRVIKEEANGIMVSPNIDKKTKEKLGFIHAETVEDALNYALKQKGEGASIVALLHAGEILPITEI